MTENENISKDSDLYQEQYLDKYFDKKISSIVKENPFPISENEKKIIDSLKDKNHYLCKECKTLHLIKIIYEEQKVNVEKVVNEKKVNSEVESTIEERIINEKKIIIKEKIVIECNKRGKIDLDKYLTDEPIENFDNYKFCQTHKENEIIGFCSKCKQNLCEKCNEVNNCENKQGHKLMEFEEKNEEIRKKEKFISEVLEKKYDDDIKTKTEKSQSRKSIGSNYFTETIGNLESLYYFNKALGKSKDKIPSYIHYENIINIYHYLCDKLKINYYCSSNNKTKIRLLVKYL